MNKWIISKELKSEIKMIDCFDLTEKCPCVFSQAQRVESEFEKN